MSICAASGLDRPHSSAREWSVLTVEAARYRDHPGWPAVDAAASLVVPDSAWDRGAASAVVLIDRVPTGRGDDQGDQIGSYGR
jgi:hypothetical protein